MIETKTTYAGISTPLISTNSYDGHGNLRSKGGRSHKYAEEPPYGIYFPSSFHQVNHVLEGNQPRDFLEYDENGNVTDMPYRNAMTLQWNSFNKLAYVKQNGATASSNEGKWGF